MRSRPWSATTSTTSRSKRSVIDAYNADARRGARGHDLDRGMRELLPLTERPSGDTAPAPVAVVPAAHPPDRPRRLRGHGIASRSTNSTSTPFGSRATAIRTSLTVISRSRPNPAASAGRVFASSAREHRHAGRIRPVGRSRSGAAGTGRIELDQLEDARSRRLRGRRGRSSAVCSTGHRTDGASHLRTGDP